MNLIQKLNQSYLQNTSEPNTVLALNSNQEEKEKSYDTEDDEKDNS